MQIEFRKYILAFLLLFVSTKAHTQEDTTVHSSEFNRAIQFVKDGNTKKAIRILNKLVEQKIDYSKSNMMLGYLYQQQKKFPEAIEAFTNVIRTEPKSAVAYFNRGNCYSEQQKYIMAINDYTYTIKQDSLFYQAYNNMAITRIYNQQSGKLRAQELKIARDNILDFKNKQTIKDKVVLSNLGLIYMHLLDFKEAVPLFSEALALDSLDGKSHYYKALSNYYLHHFAESLKGFEKAAELNFKTESAHEFSNFIQQLEQERKRLGR